MRTAPSEGESPNGSDREPWQGVPFWRRGRFLWESRRSQSGKDRAMGRGDARHEDRGGSPIVSWANGWPRGGCGRRVRPSAPIGASPASMASRWRPSEKTWRPTWRRAAPSCERRPIARGRCAGCGSRSRTGGIGPWGSRPSGIGWGSRRCARCWSRSSRWSARLTARGCRPGRGPVPARRDLYGHVRDGCISCVDVDIEPCFDEIPHEPLIDAVRTGWPRGASCGWCACSWRP